MKQKSNIARSSNPPYITTFSWLFGIVKMEMPYFLYFSAEMEFQIYVTGDELNYYSDDR